MDGAAERVDNPASAARSQMVKRAALMASPAPPAPNVKVAIVATLMAGKPPSEGCRSVVRTLVPPLRINLIWNAPLDCASKIGTANLTELVSRFLRHKNIPDSLVTHSN